MTELSSSVPPSPSGVFFSFVEEIRHQADVVLVDPREVQDLVFLLLVVRRRVEGALVAALGIHAVRRVAAELEREDARQIRRERQRLQVEHQLDVFGERVRHADRRARQLALFAAGVVGLDLLNPPLDLAHVVEIVVQARLIGGAEVLLRRGRSTCRASRGCCDPRRAAPCARPASRRRRTADRTPDADRESSAAAATATTS